MNIPRKTATFALAIAGVLGPLADARADDGEATASAAPASRPELRIGAMPVSGRVTIGVADLSESSAAYGRYNGMSKAGAGVLGSWALRAQDPWDSGGTRYIDFSGDRVNFGFGDIGPEAFVSLKTGQVGTWSVTASYSAMTYVASNAFTTILDKQGNLSPGYRAALQAANAYFTNAPANPSALFGAFNATTHLATANPMNALGPKNTLTYDIGTRRDKGAIEGTYQIDFWKIVSEISHEHKGGTLEQALTVAGSNSGFVPFAMPINYDTDSYNLSTFYREGSLQLKFAYQFSNFIDHNNAFAFQGWNFSAYADPVSKTFTSYARSGDYSLPPSNQAHTITADAAYALNTTTRLNATAVYGLQEQNAAFAPATALGYIQSPVAAPLAAQLATNPKSLDGFVQTFFGTAKMSSRLGSKIEVQASYVIDVRSPNTKPLWIYGDPTDTTALKYRQAVPAGWTKQKLSATATYRLAPETRVTVGYTYRNDNRTNAITHTARDNEESASIHSNLSTGIAASVSYLHANRSASAPDWSFWLVQVPSDCGATLALLGCQQVPFYEAARTLDTVSGQFTAMIGPKASLSIVGKYTDNRYNGVGALYNATINPSVGRNHDESLRFGPDLNYQIEADKNVHAFYTYLRTSRGMRALNDQSDPAGARFFNVDSTYEIQTVGIGGNWRANEKLKFVGDYLYSYGGEVFNQTGAWDLGFPGDPTLKTKSGSHRVKLHAVYDYSATISAVVGYEFSSLDMRDWALVAALPSQVLTGDLPAKYNVSKVVGALTWSF